MRSEDGHTVIFDDISFLEIHEISDMVYSEVRKCILLTRDFSASSSKWSGHQILNLKIQGSNPYEVT